MVRDFPRDQMPANTAWDIKDMVPDLNGEPLVKRGGWSYASPSVSSISGGTVGVYGVFSAPFNGGDRLLAFTGSGYMIDVSSATSAASISASDELFVYSAPTFYHDRIVYPTTSGLRYWTGTGSTSSVSLAPSGTSVTTYRASIVTANGGGIRNRIWFSKPGDATVWDQTNGFIDTPGIIFGLASLQSVMLVFTTTGIHRVRGAPPPYTSSTAQVSPDLTLDTIFNQSSSLTRSWVVVDDRCYFATQSGLHVTDGAGVTDLTEDSGFSRYWRDAFSTLDPRSTLDQIVVGAYRQYILCSAVYGWLSGTATDGDIGTLVYDTINKCWFRISNLIPSMYSTSRATGETYFSLRNSPYLGKLSTVFDPTSTVKEDADGTDITPTLETMYYQFRPRGTKRFKNLYVNYDLRDAASDNPTLAVGYSTTPEDTSYTSVGTLFETSEFTRKRMPLRFSGQGMALQIAQTGNSSATRIYDLEADAHAREQSRL